MAQVELAFINRVNPRTGTAGASIPLHVFSQYDVHDGTFEPVFSNVLAQDGSNMETMQAGVASDSFKGMILSDRELRLRHFHKTIDDFIAGRVDTHNLLPSDHYLERDQA